MKRLFALVISTFLVGAVASTVSAQTTPDRCPSILDHGGNNAGTVDNTAAFAATISANTTISQLCVYFPPGVYDFNSNFSYTLSGTSTSISIEGDGADVSILKWPAGGGITINYNSPYQSSHFKRLSLLTGTAGGSSTYGIHLNQTGAIANPANSALTEISGVTLRGADGYAGSYYWGTGIQSNDVSNIVISNTDITGASAGAGVRVLGVSSAYQGCCVNINNSTLNYLQEGFEYGTDFQGINITQSNITATNYGIFAPSTDANADQLTVTNCQIAANVVGIYVPAQIVNIILANNLFGIPASGTGVYMNTSSWFTSTGNIFQGFGSSSNGIIVSGTINSQPGVISGNNFYNLTTGVYLTSTSNHINVLGNVYNNDANTVINSGTSNSIGIATP